MKLLREIDVYLRDGLDVVSACRKAGISDKSYYYWRKKFGGLSRSQVSEMKSPKKEIERLKKIVADLQLDKVILKESLDHLLHKFYSFICLKKLIYKHSLIFTLAAERNNWL